MSVCVCVCVCVSLVQETLTSHVAAFPVCLSKQSRPAAARRLSQAARGGGHTGRGSGQRAALSQVLEFSGFWIWCGEAWPGEWPLLLTPYPPWTSPTSICQEKILGLLTTENTPSPETGRASSVQEQLKKAKEGHMWMQQPL